MVDDAGLAAVSDAETPGALAGIRGAGGRRTGTSGPPTTEGAVAGSVPYGSGAISSSSGSGSQSGGGHDGDDGSDSERARGGSIPSTSTALVSNSMSPVPTTAGACTPLSKGSDGGTPSAIVVDPSSSIDAELHSISLSLPNMNYSIELKEIDYARARAAVQARPTHARHTLAGRASRERGSERVAASGASARACRGRTDGRMHSRNSNAVGVASIGRLHAPRSRDDASHP